MVHITYALAATKGLVKKSYFQKNRNNFIYLPALIGVVSAVLTLMTLALLKSIFKGCRSLIRRIREKRMRSQSDDNMKLLQHKSKNDSTDTIPL